jgi:hypothetical protein
MINIYLTYFILTASCVRLCAGVAGVWRLLFMVMFRDER